MRYHVLACDYDGTLAHHGRVDAPTLAALEKVLASGRKLLLVTGRELDELATVFDHLDLFEWVVAENGALLYQPASKQEKLLGERPPERFLQALRERGVEPVSVGRVIVATWEPHEAAVLDAIRALGLELQVIFNKGAVMVLPAGVNKATGLAAALRELGLSAHNVVGVGDAENDHAFLALCECAAAVANALPGVKERADVVTRGDHGAGVAELIDELVETDLAGRDDRLARHHLLLGTRDDGTEARLPPYGGNLLIAGPSGSGKSTAATGLLERLAEAGYQFCILDPEGDYETFEGAAALGGEKQPPTHDEVLDLLKNPDQNLVVNLLGLPLADRPGFFLTLLSRLQEMRARTGRPHWLIVDEAHHLFPTSWQPTAQALPQELRNLVLITVHPDHVAPAILSTVTTVMAVGGQPEAILAEFCGAVGDRQPVVAPSNGEAGEVLVWSRQPRAEPYRAQLIPAKTERRRHSRKYTHGELPPDESFYFTGPEGKLNLRAQNFSIFFQLADGLDDDTWTYHLRRGDYSGWVGGRLRDRTLAEEVAEVERQPDLTAADSRARLREAVQRHYPLDATPTFPMPGTPAQEGRAGPG